MRLPAHALTTAAKFTFPEGCAATLDECSSTPDVLVPAVQVLTR
jgi:hypothetical protein